MVHSAQHEFWQASRAEVAMESSDVKVDRMDADPERLSDELTTLPLDDLVQNTLLRRRQRP